MHACQIQGEDVIGFTSQNLTTTELQVLVGLAEGLSPSAIGASINANSIAMRGIESSIRAKLGARSQPHMIARAFLLGVLAPRALCMLLAAASALEAHHDALRTRHHRRHRSPPSHSLVLRSTPASAGNRAAPQAAPILGQLIPAHIS